MKKETQIITQIKHQQFDLAVTAISESYHELLYWHIRKLVKHHDDANDALQNTYVRIYKGLENFGFKSSVKTWCYRIAYNEAIRLLQKNQRLMHRDSIEEGNDYFALLTADPYFDLDSASHAFHESLQKLTEKQQRIFQMKYFDDMKYQEISDILDTSVGALKASYHHAVKKIELAFKED